MKSVISVALFLFQLLAGVAAFLLAVLVSWLAFGVPFGFSMLSGLAAGLLTFFGLKWGFSNKNIKKSGLSRREYRYIQEQINEAKLKVGRLQKVMFSVGNVFTIKQNYDVIKVAKKIQSIVENEPRRFYEVEPFYYSHLDSMVELTEKYAFLTKQPVKTKEIQSSLNDTRQTISSMAETIGKDLSKLLANDIDSLRIELDVAKQSIDKNKHIEGPHSKR
ncbi:MAG: 5-bromo-4-chloroindolyl phosphate hydrolysis family protein [Bacillus sp. (in: firmicutes)]